jgi:hypothetical protein
MADSPVRYAQECRTFARYLCGIDAPDDVVRSYLRGLQSTAFRDGPPVTPLDDMLQSLARRGVLRAALADTYARFFAPGGALRRRLVLLLAILESGPLAQAFEPPEPGTARAFVELIGLAARFALLLPAALIVVGPLHVVTLVRGRPAVSQ